MNPASEKSLESIRNITEDGNAKFSASDGYRGISISPQPFDAQSYSDNCPFDDVFFQSFKGLEPCLYGLEYDPTSTAISSPSTCPTLATRQPSATSQEFPFRTRNDPGDPQPMAAMSSPSIRKQCKDSLPSPNQISLNIGFGLSNETDSNAKAQIQSVRNSQLEKVNDISSHPSTLLTYYSDGLKIGTLNVLSGSGRNPTPII